MICHRSRAFKVGYQLARLLKLACILSLATLATAQDQQPDLTQLSPEQLSKIEVTSVSKKEQKLSDTAAAIYVITQQDIRNSTATTIPELLRMVPGLDVAQVNSGVWAISARGFTQQYANKMLVLIDGRSVFHPLFSGVVWTEQDLLLEDIERIEIIRGPGATVWGTNAVNGVINIITKSAKETVGALVTAGVGNLERSSGSARYGGKLGSSTNYRIYSKYFDDGPTMDIFGESAHDSRRAIRGGFRMDTRISERDVFMLEGDAFGSKVGTMSERFSYTAPYISTFVDPQGDGGTNLQAQWIHKSLTGSETSVQATYSHMAESWGLIDINGNVASLSVQHSMLVGDRHNIVAGLQFDYRAGRTSISSPVLWLEPSNPNFQIASGFIQDEMLFANGAIHFTTGLRIDHNSLTGMGFQPNARLLWKINPMHSVWLAYSLANRSMSPADTAIRNNQAAFPGPLGTQVVRFYGNPAIQSEKVNAFEAGYRIQPRKTVSIDLATFYNRYSDLVGVETGAPFFEPGPPPRLVLPVVEHNDVSGPSFGAEFTARWAPVERVHLSAAYSLIDLAMVQSAAAAGNFAAIINGSTPRHKLAVDSSFNLTKTIGLSTALSFVDRRTYQKVPGYTQVDSKIVWHPRQYVDLSVGTTNLFNKEHVEFFSELGGIPSMVGRTFYAKTTWHF
ncbi:MAG TPA: TonB-dependent receptor [Alphaproteobacteria bacterium]|nr:TonB-dependent receptor [Alphaproteobacteria bacterium]